jgi:hypothetical protein
MNGYTNVQTPAQTQCCGGAYPQQSPAQPYQGAQDAGEQSFASAQLTGSPGCAGPQFAAAGDISSPITALNQPAPVTTQSMQYINGFLRTMVGRKVTVDFLIGTTSLIDKTGTLLGVGANYILINEIETDDLLVCDFYSIKFVRVYY